MAQVSAPTKDQEYAFFAYPAETEMPESIHGPISKFIAQLGGEYEGEGEWVLGDAHLLAPTPSEEDRWMISAMDHDRDWHFPNLQKVSDFLEENEWIWNA